MKRVCIPIFILTILTLFSTLLLFTGCQTDYDIADVASAEFLDSEEHVSHDHDNSDGECVEESHEELSVEDSHAGHDHASGTSNHGTQWFFGFFGHCGNYEVYIFLTKAKGLLAN